MSILVWVFDAVINMTEDFRAVINKELYFRYTVISSRWLFRLTSKSGIFTPVTQTVRSSA